MGTVYQAIDPLIERTVAIKTINLDLSKDERAEFEERFYREAKSAGRLSHANIVTIYDVGETDDIAYIAMEFVKGESLREVLDSGVVLPVDVIVRIASRIASALNYAHENNVVHRDIKPANIMITPGYEAKIMDFGIAQISTGSRTQLGTVLGSPKYMAPEQVEGQAVDGKTDIFALGVVLYEMLTGATPFTGDNLSAIMYKILNEIPVPPSTINPRVPPVFDQIIRRALAKRPEDRYQTAREFARDLRNPDAVTLGDAKRLDNAITPNPVSATSKAPAGPLDATVFLTPNKARAAKAGGTAHAGGDIPATAPIPFFRTSQGRNLLWFGMPLLFILAVWWYAGPNGTPDSPVNAVADKASTETKPPQAMAPSGPVRVEEPAPLLPPQSLAGVPPVAQSDNPAETRPAKQAVATVSFAVSPWGEIFIDGNSAGVSPPLNQLQLEAGVYKVEIHNQSFAPYRHTVKLSPGQTLKIRHKFR